MARYRKCPRPCAQGKSCKWISKMLQQVPPLKCPYFLKNISSFMLWRPTNPCPRMELPAEFVQGHGDKFHETVEVKGPGKKTWTMRVSILTCEYRRVMLDKGWRTFVKDLGLNKGDHLLFVLTAFSKFKVYVFDDVGARRRPSTFQGPHQACENEYVPRECRGTASPSATSMKRPLKPAFDWEKEDEYLRQDGPLDNISGGRHQTPGAQPLWHERVGHVEREPCKRKLRGPKAEPVVVELSDDKGKELSDSETTFKESETESEEAQSSFQPSQRISGQKKPCSAPRFIKQLSAVCLRHESGPNCTHLEVPATFSQRFEGLFKQRISLQGPSGRIWHVTCHTSVQQQYRRVKLKAGWLHFAEDNNLSLNDQLLFTYAAEGHFVVQIVGKGRRRGRPPRQEKQECSRSIPGGGEHQGGARTLPDDQPHEPTTSRIQQPDNNKLDPLRSEIHELQQQLLALREVVHRQVENRFPGRRGRMEWGLGYS